MAEANKLGLVYSRYHRVILSVLVFILSEISAVLLFQYSMFVIVWPLFVFIGMTGAVLWYLNKQIIGVLFITMVILTVFIGKPEQLVSEYIIENDKKVTEVVLEIAMQNSQLTVTSGKEKLVSAHVFDSKNKFTLAEANSEKGDRKTILLKQQFVDILRSGKENVMVSVNQNIPIDMTVSVKDTPTQLLLRDLQFSGILMRITSADVYVEMCQKCEGKTVFIEAWSSRLKIRVPKDAGISVQNNAPTTVVVLPNKKMASGKTIETDNFATAPKKYVFSAKGSNNSIVFEEYTVE